MSTPHLIALAGFDPFEQTTFESFFRLATRRDPGYDVCADLARADLLIINSDDADALVNTLRVRRVGQRVLLIGPSAQPAAAGMPVQQRPIRFMSVLAVVDKLLVAPAPALAAAPARAPVQAPVPDFQATQAFRPSEHPQPRPDFQATQPFARLEAADSESSTGFAATQPFAPLTAGQMPAAPVVIPMPVRREELITAESLAGYRRSPAPRTPDFQSTTGFLGLGTAAMPAVPAQPIDDVLVVDDSDVALKFMQNRLGRMGFRVTVARSGEDALAALPSRNFHFVFLDVMMDGMDGFQTCRAIKKRSYPAGSKSPVVFMLSSRGGVIDKMRGSLAGADAYMTKPLNEPELRKLLAKHDVQAMDGFAATREVNPASLPGLALPRRSRP